MQQKTYTFVILHKTKCFHLQQIESQTKHRQWCKCLYLLVTKRGRVNLLSFPNRKENGSVKIEQFLA